jgi:hypothetical protein
MGICNSKSKKDQKVVVQENHQTENNRGARIILNPNRVTKRSSNNATSPNK